MGVEATREIAVRVRRMTTSADVLALCDAVLAGAAPVEPPVRKAGDATVACPVCAARRDAKAASMRRYRARKA